MSRPTHEMVEDNVISWQVAVYELHREIDKLDQEKELIERWVADLQSGMYINCVYCGHQYGPKESTPISMADVLKEHISRCPKHPLSTANTRIQALEAVLRKIAEDDCEMLFQDVAAIALGCTCTDYHRQKLISAGDCPFHSPVDT